MAVSAATCVLKLSGTSTAFTGEATTNTSGNTYQITDSTKRALDPATSITVYDGGSPVAAGNVTVDFLFGKVTLSSPPGGAVTIDGNYLPLHAMAEVRSFEINLSGSMLDDTVMSSSTSVHSRMLGIADASGSVTGLDPLTTDLDSGGGTLKPESIFAAGTPILLDVDFPAGNNFRAWVLFDSAKVSGGWDALVEGTINWQAIGRTASAGAGANEAASFGWG